MFCSLCYFPFFVLYKGFNPVCIPLSLIIIKSLTLHFSHHLQFVCKLLLKLILDAVHVIIFIHPELHPNGKHDTAILTLLSTITQLLFPARAFAQNICALYTHPGHSGNLFRDFPRKSRLLCDDWLIPRRSRVNYQPSLHATNRNAVVMYEEPIREEIL